MGILNSETHSLDWNPLSDLLLKTLLAALSFLLAMQFRDCIVQGVALFVPADAMKKFVFSCMLALFFLFVTVLLAFSFQDQMD